MLISPQLQSWGFFFVFLAFPFIWWSLFLTPFDSLKAIHYPGKSIAFPPDRPPLLRNEIEKALTGDEEMIRHLLKTWNHFEKSDLKPNSLKIFPQSYATASLALSLTDHPQIVALPSGFKEFQMIFSKSTLEPILEVDRYQIHKLRFKKTDLALISSYSNPQILAMLRAFRIPMSLSPTPSSLSEVHKMIDLLPFEKSALMSLFVQSLTEELILRAKLAFKNFPRVNVLLLDHTKHLVPFISRKLWLPFLEELNINTPIHVSTHLKNPDVLILASTNPQTLKLTFNHMPHLKKISKIYLMDQRVASFSTHLNLLALFEFVQIYITCLHDH